MISKQFSKIICPRMGLFLVLITTIALLVSSCGSKSGPEMRTKKVKEGNLEISVGVPKGDFKIGKKIPISISVKNAGREIEFLHYSTDQRYDLDVTDASKKAIWRWSQGRFFGLVLSEIKMEPDESEDSDVVWSQKDTAGNQVLPGKYTLTAKGKADETTKTVSIDIKIVK